MTMDSPVMIPNIYEFTREDFQYIWICLLVYAIFMDSPVRIPNDCGFTCEDSQYLLINL